MEEKMERASTMLIQEEKIDCLYPMYFGVSCAFVALKILAESDVDDMQWSEARDRMLQGSASLLGLLVWRVQRAEAEGRSELLHKLKKVETEVAELKRRRSEDAKANEKVVSIYAAQEQCWLGERKKLQLRIVALAKQLRIRETQEEETISTLNKMAQDKDLLINFRDKALEEVEGKRKEIEEMLHKAEATIEELKEAIKKEVEEHASEIWKHKTAVIELVSNQRQLEAEMGRAFRQVESAKQEFDSVLKQKEESVLMAKKLSVEMVKMCKDSEQKDKILSAMLRKSKLDTAEKQILLKEVKISKAKEKQAELDTDRWRAVCESRHEQHSSRRNLPNQAESRSDIYSRVKGTWPTEAGSSQNWRIGSQPNSKKVNPKTLLLEYLEAEHRNEWECIAPHRAVDATSGSSNKYLSEGNQDLDVEHLEGWVRSETEKNITMLEQRHHLEIDAFAEELRHKDEKLEASRWRLLSMELESKRLQSCMQELDQNLARFREENMKLEALLLNREGELKSLTEFIDLHLKTHHCQKTDWNSSVKGQAEHQNAIWSEVKIIKFKPSGAGEPKHTSTQESDTEKDVQIPLSDQSQEIGVQAPEKEIEVEKEVTIDWGVGERCLHPQDIKIINKLASDNDHLIKKDASPWKMDLHALGVSYNIKRLNQQLLLLDKLAGRPKSCDKKESDDDAPVGIKNFVLLMSLLSKQVSRYHNLQAKINDLCKRMHENEIEETTCDSKTARTNEEIKTLGSFLEETFQLQRYMVATGQKLTEIQSRIASGLVAGVKDNNRSARFDMGRFSESVKNLFKEVQRGLEVRIAKIIGNIEGTLASDGIIHVRNKCK